MSLAVLGLHDARRARVSGRIVVGGRDVVGLPEEEMRRLRGREVAMVFQDPLSALHPYYTVGRQIVEAYRVHHPEVGTRAARTRAVEMLGRVGIPQPGRRFDQFPHEFSGGMRQRVMIAMALVNDPALVIADEPTTALDVTVQAQILDLLADLQAEFGSAIVLITHDLGVVSQVADEVLVMYAGRVAEYGGVRNVLRSPQHPYTWGLLSSVPSLAGPAGVELVPIRGNPPSLIDVPTGCACHPRCRFAELTEGRSRSVVPGLVPVDDSGHAVACHLDAGRRRELGDRQRAEAGTGVAR